MRVLLFYLYTPVEDVQDVVSKVRVECERLGLLGRVIVAGEGINGTLEGTIENTDAFASWITAFPEFKHMQIKRSASSVRSFPRLKVRAREEIVGTRFPKSINPVVETATRLPADGLRKWFESGEEFTIVDMRNSYEYASGHFKNSIDPGLKHSRDLPLVIDSLMHLKDKKVLTVCTGGVRCEKMSAYLLKEGFNDVYQLDGGIHTYMEKYPAQDFEGSLYTFDTRVAMDFGGYRKVIGVCEYCKESTERYVNCSQFGCKEHYLACSSCVQEDRTRLCLKCESDK